MTVKEALQEFEDMYGFIIDRGYSSEDADGMIKYQEAIATIKKELKID